MNEIYLKVLIDSDLDQLEIDNLQHEIEGLVGVLEVEKAAEQLRALDDELGHAAVRQDYAREFWKQNYESGK